MASNGISNLQYKRDRQNAKLSLAAVRRGETGRKNVLEKTLLPARYGIDSNNPADIETLNDSLTEGRPWTQGDGSFVPTRSPTFVDKSRTITSPSSEDGDYILLFVSTWDGDPTVIVSDEFTLITKQSTVDGTHHLHIYEAFRGVDDVDVTATKSGTGRIESVSMSFRDVESDMPYEALDFIIEADVINAKIPAHTTTDEYRLIVAGQVNGDQYAEALVSVPNGYISRESWSVGIGGDNSFIVLTRSREDAGTYGEVSWLPNESIEATNMINFVIALRPSS